MLRKPGLAYAFTFFSFLVSRSVSGAWTPQFVLIVSLSLSLRDSGPLAFGVSCGLFDLELDGVSVNAQRVFMSNLPRYVTHLRK